MTELPRCKQTCKDGSPCKANARPGSDVCAFHDPTLAERRQEARRKGGRKRSRPAAVLPDAEDLPLQGPADVTVLLGKSINEVRQGKLDPKVCNAVGYLSSVLLRSFEVGDQEERLAAIEQRLKVEAKK